MIKPINKQRLILLSCLLLTPVLHASNVSFLKYATITDFNDADIQQMLDESNTVLNNKKPGEVHVWKNGESENGGEITIIRQYQEQENQCKRLKFRNHSKHQSGVAYFNFCFIEKSWKLVN